MFNTTSRLHPSRSSITIQSAKGPTQSLMYSDSSLCNVLLIVTISGVWGMSCI
ncbi:BgTH12-06361 [Blumeria graminis f. sp. triticale]|uniref:Bgt-51540 n=2 Tax=Blumeria graminis TaxID=34373 RepID=A0A9X9LBL1_BLUGR|nr:BgTH12-06361 [Blumeria graminis f. sp. triticale]VCU40928.1 Bgt-51540 [Blumeria graminis f. sp. tritici]